MKDININDIQKNKYDLFFENSQGKQLLIKNNITSDEAVKIIRDYCHERDFKIYYIRTMFRDNGEIQYDVGSHTEFFWLKKAKLVKD